MARGKVMVKGRVRGRGKVMVKGRVRAMGTVMVTVTVTVRVKLTNKDNYDFYT